MPPAIRVHNLGKRYRISHEGDTHGKYRTLRDTVMDLAKMPLRKLQAIGSQKSEGGSQASKEDFWALKDVSFDVQPGEVVGIIGRNGAGKSTLLKILSRITKPTTGSVELNGRVGSLLEVGTGFHPELTGRENIFLNGSILGMKRAEIQQQFDAIVDFSGVEKFLDTPVKRYSSGMYVRLAFAVAAHLQPEILVVDEVLAVGDADFQKRCLGKMNEVAAHGRTVLFVSHNMAAISQLCQNAIWLDNGQLVSTADASTSVDSYLKQGLSATSVWSRSPQEAANELVELRSLRVLGASQRTAGHLDFDCDFQIEIQYHLRSPVPAFSILLRIQDASGNIIFTSWDTDGSMGKMQHRGRGDYSSTCEIFGGLLRPGLYSVSAGARAHNLGLIDFHDGIASFEISDRSFPLNRDRAGIITPVLHWKLSPAPTSRDIECQR